MTRGTQVSKLRDMRGAANAASVAAASPTSRVDADVGAVLLVQQRRAGLGGVGRERHARQRLVVDLDPLGAVLGSGERFRHHHGDRLADETRLVDAAAESPAR